MSDELALQERPLTAVEVKAQVQVIQEVMKGAMLKDKHYGTVPGCGDRPTLLKPGAEKLMMTFRLAVDPQVIDVPTEDGITFRVLARVTSQSTGAFLGTGIGECSTKEEKYNWRRAVCEGEYNATPEDRRRGKWVKGYKGEADKQLQQVRTNPADLSNTVLKMAKKRALVDAVLTVTAASDIFDQDLEEMAPENMQGTTASKTSTVKSSAAPQQNKKTAPKAEQPETEQLLIVTGQIEDISTRQGEKNGKPWQVWTIVIDGVKYGTFSETIALNASQAQDDGLAVEIGFVEGKYGNEIKTLVIEDAADKQ